MEIKTRFEIFKRALQRDMKFIKVGYVVLLLLVISFMFFFVTIPTYTADVKDVRNSLVEKDSIVQLAVNNMIYEGPQAVQIKEQFQITKEVKESYMMVAFWYTVYNYSFSIFLTIFSVITGLLGFLLAKKGWDNTDNYYLKASFMVSFFCASLFGIMPRVMGTEDNIKNNLSQYHLYSEIQMDLYTLAKDNKGYFKKNDSTAIKNLNKEILAITERIKTNENLYFDIHIDQVPTEITPDLENGQ